MLTEPFFVLQFRIIVLNRRMIVLRFRTIILRFRMNNPSARDDFCFPSGLVLFLHPKEFLSGATQSKKGASFQMHPPLLFHTLLTLYLLVSIHFLAFTKPSIHGVTSSDLRSRGYSAHCQGKIARSR